MTSILFENHHHLDGLEPLLLMVAIVRALNALARVAHNTRRKALAVPGCPHHRV